MIPQEIEVEVSWLVSYPWAATFLSSIRNDKALSHFITNKNEKNIIIQSSQRMPEIKIPVLYLYECEDYHPVAGIASDQFVRACNLWVYGSAHGICLEKCSIFSWPRQPLNAEEHSMEHVLISIPALDECYLSRDVMIYNEFKDAIFSSRQAFYIKIKKSLIDGVALVDNVVEIRRRK